MTRLILALLFTGVTLVAAPITRVTLIDAGRPLAYDGTHYVGPYTLEINGREMPVLCIDLQDESFLGEQWDADLTPIEADLGGTYHPDGLLAYEQEAYLYSLITQPGADRIDIQHAAWAITDEQYPAGPAASRWITEAREKASTLDLSQYEIISAVDRQEESRPQEFITAVPEASLLNLFAGLLAIGLAVLGKKRG